MSRALTFFSTLGVALAAWAFFVFFDSTNVLNLSSKVQSIIVAVSPASISAVSAKASKSCNPYSFLRMR